PLVEETARCLLARQESPRPSLAEVETVAVEVDVGDRDGGGEADGGARAMDGDVAGGGEGGDRDDDGQRRKAGQTRRGEHGEGCPRRSSIRGPVLESPFISGSCAAPARRVSGSRA